MKTILPSWKVGERGDVDHEVGGVHRLTPTQRSPTCLRSSGACAPEAAHRFPTDAGEPEPQQRGGSATEATPPAAPCAVFRRQTSGWRQQRIAGGSVVPPALRWNGPDPEIQVRPAGPLSLPPSSGGAARSPIHRAARRGAHPATTKELGSGGSVPQGEPVWLILEPAGYLGGTTGASALASAHAGGGSRGDSSRRDRPAARVGGK